MPEIYLRAVEPSDAEILYLSENDDESWGDSDTIAPLSRRMLREYAANYLADPIKDGQLRLMAADKSDGSTVGILDFYEIELLHRHAFVAIYILPEMRDKGYASAVLEEAALYAKQRLGLNQIAAKILPSNITSQHLFCKAGYRHCATLPEWHFSNGNLSDMYIYTLHLT